MRGSRGVPSFVDAREHVQRELVRFARTLRANGVAVPATASLSAARALATVGLADEAAVRAATAATLVSEAGDRATFDDHFPAFWHRLRTGLEAVATVDDVGDRTDDGTPTTRGLAAADGADDGTEADAAVGADERDRDPERDGGPSRRRVADAESSGALVPDEADSTRSTTYSGAGEGHAVEAVAAGAGLDRDALRRFERALATLAGRRWRPADGDGAVDVRRALRGSLATGGVPTTLPRRDRRRTALRWTILVDVSRSVLDTVDRSFLLSFLDAAVADGRTVRVFLFDTEIREVTDAFDGATGRGDGATPSTGSGDHSRDRDRDRDPAAALSAAEVSWGGGTRIGDAFATLRERWPDAVDRRTVTLVVSDGLDVGAVDRLERGAAWLARRSAALVWLNPLAASPAYEPTCRGMAAALPAVDALFAFAGPADVREVARQLDRHGPGGPVGYAFDFRDRTGADLAGGVRP